MKNDFDVIIVGGGPAGAITARELRRKEPGLNVLLLEKAAMPRLKPCAGGIAPKAEQLLHQLDLWDQVFPKVHVLRAAELLMPNGRSIRLAGSKNGSAIHRAIFDELLFREAEASGAVVHENMKADSLIFESDRIVGVRCGEDEYRAPLTVIAAGATTKFRRPDPEKEYITSCTAWFRHAKFEPNTVKMVFSKELAPHYMWLFPESDNSCNIGLCIRMSKLRSRSGVCGHRSGKSEPEIKSSTITDLYQSVLYQYFSDTVRSAEMIIPPKVFPISPSKRIGEGALPGTLLVGEAGRMVNAFTGEGISYALESGVIASEIIINARRNNWDWNRMHEEYLLRIRKKFRKPLKSGRVLCTFGSAMLNIIEFLFRMNVFKDFLVKMMTKG